ncbi:MAG: hypothetical protein M3O15_04985 [Acidobacteriota bacterium]|nr:hypothetical protein [Acidobacteriota bacterium]
MRKSTCLPCLMVAALCLTAGCARQDASATQSSGPIAPGAQVAPARAKLMLDSADVGHQLTADGAIPPDQIGKRFAAGDPIFLSLTLGKVPAGSSVRADWYGPGDAKISSEAKTVPAGASHLDFKADSSTWQQGDYRAEVWIGDQRVQSQQFSVVPKS